MGGCFCCMVSRSLSGAGERALERLNLAERFFFFKFKLCYVLVVSLVRACCRTNRAIQDMESYQSVDKSGCSWLCLL